MLTTIRDKATGWIAGVIVGLLIISFAFWGVSFYSGQGAEINVANVNGENISYQSYQRSFTQLRKQMISVLGDSLSLEEEDLIKKQTVEKLIESQLIDQLVIDNGFNITNEKLVESIKNIEFFRNDDGFDRVKYERSINTIGMDPTIFEAQLRMDLLSEQLQAGFSETVFVLNSELQNILRLESQTRDITYSILSLPEFIEDGEIEESVIKEYYEANPTSFIEPEKVKIEYLELDIKELADNVNANEESLREFYNDNKDNYDVADQRSVQKLFVRLKDEDAKEYKDKAKEIITSAFNLVNQGKDFEEIIEDSKNDEEILEFSEHTFMSKGIMEQEIDEFLFNSGVGTTSKIIKTKRGLNIVKVIKIKGGPENKYENSAEKVEEDFRMKEAELQFFELADQLTTLSYENSDTLEIAADAIGKQVQITDFFSRDNDSEDLISDPRIISKSFDTELIRTGINSDAIELSDDHIIILRVLDYKEAATKPLEGIQDEVIASIRLERADNKISEIGDRIVTELRTGVRPEDITSYQDIEWISTERIKRDDVTVSRAILRSVFEVEKPGNKPIITNKRLGSGDYAIIMVTKAHDDITQVDEEVEKSTDLKLRHEFATNEWKDLLRDVRKNAKITIFDENI